MNVTAERIPESQVVLTIEVDDTRVERSMDQAYRRVAPKLRIPGFRPGKAPRHILERHVGRAALLQEALDRLVPEVVDEAIKDQALEMIAQPDLEIESIEPVVIKATIPVRPQVDLGGYRDLRLEAEAVTVEEAEIDQAIEDLQHRYATIAPVERPVQVDDRVRMSYEATVDGERVVQQENIEVAVTEETLAGLPGMFAHLPGAEAEAAFEFDHELPADFVREDLAGKTMHYTVTVHDVKEEQMPGLDEEFARQVGEGFESIAALRAHLAEEARLRHENTAKRALEEQAVNALVEAASLDFPPQLIEREVDAVLGEMTNSMSNDRRAFERALRSAGRTEEEIRGELRPAAVDRVRRSLVLSTLAEREGITVTAEDIEEDLVRMVGDGPQAAQLRQIFDTPSGREVIERQVRSRKTLERLTAIVTGVAPPAPPAPEEAAVPDAAPATDAPPAEGQ